MARTTTRDAIPRVTKDNIVEAVEKLKRVVEIGAGRRGDGLDRYPTLRELESKGLIRVLKKNPVTVGEEQPPEIDFLPPDGPISFKPPPVPTGFAATPAVISVILDWDDPESKYRNHSYTEIWRAGVDDIGQAVRVGTSNSFVWADDIGDAGGTYYYWIRFVSRANIKGPFNAVAGTVAIPDPADTSQIADLAITSAKIADLAVVNAKIANATITEAKIGDAEISTAKIQLAAITTALVQDLAVTTAKIDDLSVTTLKVAGNAITIPVSSFTSGSTPDNGTSWKTVQSVAINSSGAPINVFFTCVITATVAESDVSPSDDIKVECRVRRDGTEVWLAAAVASPELLDAASYNKDGETVIAISFEDQPGSGSYSYTFELRTQNSFVSYTAYRRSALAIETKR